MRNTVLGMALLAVLGGEAHAAERGPWYIGAGAGRSMFSGTPWTDVSFSSIAVMDINSQEFRYLPAIGGINTLGLRSSGVRAYGGFRVNRYFALEAGYTDFGKITFAHSDLPFCGTEPIVVPIVPGSLMSCPMFIQRRQETIGEITAHGWNLGMRAFLPLGERFELNGRLGLLRSTATLRAIQKKFVQPSFESGPIPIERTAHRISPLTGIGMSYRIAPELSVTLDWERIGKIGSADTTGEMSVRLLSAGFRFDF